MENAHGAHGRELEHKHAGSRKNIFRHKPQTFLECRIDFLISSSGGNAWKQNCYCGKRF